MSNVKNTEGWRQSTQNLAKNVKAQVDLAACYLSSLK